MCCGVGAVTVDGRQLRQIQSLAQVPAGITAVGPVSDHSITLVLTSCGRWHLLAQTLTSLFQHVDHAFAKAIIIDDSASGADLSWITSMVPCQLEIMANQQQLGQIASVDRAYQQVTTPWIFHCEDDWQFTASGFMGHSLDIMQDRADIITVWLRCWTDTNGHPLDPPRPTEPFRLLADTYRGKWHGFTFNPGLRRLGDYHKLAPFSGLACLPFSPPKRRKPHQWQLGEADISMHYHRLGYRAAISARPEGYVQHRGDDHHLPSWRD